MIRGALLLAAVLAFGCTTPLQEGERRYREGDRLGALEIWRAAPTDAAEAEDVAERIRVVEAEFERLVVQYKQRGRYYEGKERLVESILNYRLALELQPDDRDTLAHVQELARTVKARKAEGMAAYERAFAAEDLPAARAQLAALRTLDPFDAELETDERELGAALGEAIVGHMAEGKRGFAAGDNDRATRAFRAVLALDPDNESARGYLSYIQSVERRGSDGGTVSSRAFASEAEIRAEGFYQNALSAERQGRLYTAIRHDLRALQAHGQHAQARRHLSALRKRLAGRVPTLIEAGRAAFRDEDLQSALDHWRRALLVDPRNERVTAYIARAEQQLENLERLRAAPAPRGRS